MPTEIPKRSSYHFDGTRFVYRKHKRSTVLAAFVIFASLTIFPNCAAPTYAHSLEQRREAELVSDQTQLKVATYIRHVNSALTNDDALSFAKYAVSAAGKFRLDLPILLALVRVESGFKPEVVSKMGALGLTQVIPKWHTKKIVEARKVFSTYSIFEPKLNLYVGAWALREFIDSSQSLVMGLLAYNGSSTDPTQHYARTVVAEAYNVRVNFLSIKPIL